MTEYKRLIDIIPDGLTNGLFKYFDTKNVPWAEEDISAQLDYEYFGNISGDKIASPALEKFDANGAHISTRKVENVNDDIDGTWTRYELETPLVSGTRISMTFECNGDQFLVVFDNDRVIDSITHYADGIVEVKYDGESIILVKSTTSISYPVKLLTYIYYYTLTSFNTFYDIILAMNLTRWQKLWNTLSFEYDPISNYDMTEIMTDDETVIEYGKSETRTDNLSHSSSGQETETPNLTRITTNKVNGFNGATAQPADETDEHTTGTNGTSRQGTETDTGTQTNVDSGSDTHTRNYELHRTGNIGVTTSQQMLESERAVWMWKFFYDVVFPDCDRVLTIQTY